MINISLQSAEIRFISHHHISQTKKAEKVSRFTKYMQIRFTKLFFIKSYYRQSSK